MSRQQDLFTDLPRGEQLRLLRQLELPTYQHTSGKVSGAIQKAVLRAIDDHAGNRECFASQQTLARVTGYSVSAIKRSIAALVALDFITIERPNPMASNRHRIVWNSVRLYVDRSSSMVHSEPTTVHHEPTRVHRGTSEGSQGHLREFTEAPLRVHSEPQPDPLPDQIPATTTRPSEWEELVVEMYRWGLKTAGQAVDAARERGLSIEFVRELFREAGGNREPQRWEPGLLSNWLTGKTPPPFDESEVLRRIDNRDRARQARADAIRESVRQAGAGQPEWLVCGITYRKLLAAGLDCHATEAEAAGAARMDEIDRNREKKQSVPEKRAPRIDNDERMPLSPTLGSNIAQVASRSGYEPRRVPSPGIGKRRREITQALLACGTDCKFPVTQLRL